MLTLLCRFNYPWSNYSRFDNSKSDDKWPNRRSNNRWFNDSRSNNSSSKYNYSDNNRSNMCLYCLNSTILFSMSYWFKYWFLFSISEGCQPKDSDACLQASPAWSTSYTCSNSIRYCFSYVKDMRRCCPESCGVGTGVFTEDECNAVGGPGVCTYPNEAQCPNTVAKRKYPYVP